MIKTVLLIHGWPQPIIPEHPLHKYFISRGYKIVSPCLLEGNVKFEAGEITNFLVESLGGQQPEVIAGCSMGGFLMPLIAKKYPAAKLIFSATGPRLQPKSLILKWAIADPDGALLKVVLTLAKYTPDAILVFFHKLINPVSGGGEERDYYQKDMVGNVRWTKKIPADKQIEVLKYVKSIDNSELLSTISNKTLIFAGSQDILMPAELAKELHQLLKNSRLVISDRGHFNVIWSETFQILDEFLG